MFTTEIFPISWGGRDEGGTEQRALMYKFLHNNKISFYLLYDFFEIVSIKIVLIIYFSRFIATFINNNQM